jgi:AraC family transcriptional regulator
MEKLNVHIIKLEPQRVASFYAFGPSPEEQAWKKLEAWAGPRGYLDDPERHRIFGFNNPDPAPGSPNYGYEFWITISPEIEPEGEMRVLKFTGGLYAVSRLIDPFVAPYDKIPEGWKQLVMWMEDSPYKHGAHQWLEEHLRTEQTPPGAWSMDLYLPIIE